MRISIVIFATYTLFAAQMAVAQEHQTTGAFVTAGAHATITRRPLQELSITGLATVDLSGTSAGGIVGVGTFIAPAATLRLEFSASGRQEGETETRGIIEQIYGGLSPGGSQIIIFEPPVGRTRRAVDERDMYVLAGYHTASSRRVRLAYLAGTVIRFTRSTSESTDYQLQYDTSPRNLFEPISLMYVPRMTSSRSRSYGAGLALGVDADIVLSARMSMAPQIRATVQGGSLSVRPGISVRWAFP